MSDAVVPARRGPHPSHGFTLIELMIVLAVVGMLAALAIPGYRNYVTRARVSEGLGLAQPVKYAVAEYYSVHGRLPDISPSNWMGVLGALGIDASSHSAAKGEYTRRIWFYNNADAPAIKIRYRGGAIDDQLVFLQARLDAGSIRWSCSAPSSDGVPERYLPASCR
ncbi:pilus protein [Salinisphaera orenii YIM 95161]|uniref:Pilus protein n=2 Tax=Salinisphaera TaxID=180541 RepID=A0A423QAY6_9GAMM|nr:pilus protein [Salinisphaera halophila YIM 95161]